MLTYFVHEGGNREEVYPVHTVDELGVACMKPFMFSVVNYLAWSGALHDEIWMFANHRLMYCNMNAFEFRKTDLMHILCV